MKKIILLLWLMLPAVIYAQNFSAVDQWLHSNTANMGGRSVLMIYKDGKVVYSNAVNHLTGKQKVVGQLIVRRQNRKADLFDFTPATRQLIASCSKWLSAALVMSFVDELMKVNCS